MQQTETYKLNLIEKTDTFSPDALNENMEKVEGALETKADAAQTAADHAALEQRVEVLELHHFAAGTYIGNGEKYGDPQIIELGFTPKAVIVAHPTLVKDFLCLSNRSCSALEIVSGGFKVLKQPNPYGSEDANSNGARYPYVAFC